MPRMNKRPNLMQVSNPPKSVIDFFESRTRLHVELVRDNLELMHGFMGVEPELLDVRASNHDLSKYDEIERLAYIWLGWKYLNHAIDQTYGRDIEEAIRIGRRQHFEKNAHHPEYHSDVNQMTLLDLIEMVCDWTAIAQENGTKVSSCYFWASLNLGQRWTFDSERKNLIFKIIAELDRRNVEKYGGLRYVVFPDFKSPDAEHILSARRIGDFKSVSLIAPHITLSCARLTRVNLDTIEMNPFTATFERAHVQPPSDVHRSWYAFLAPIHGCQSLQVLRQRLNISANHEFIPHITIGSFRSKWECQAFVETYNRSAYPINANITKVSVVEVQSDALVIRKEVPLRHFS